MDFLPGQLLNNRYRIEHKLGQGGMGAVFLAVDTALDAQVAVKVNRNPGEQSTSQFLREARLLASLRHPNLPRVTDYFVLDNAQYLVMDFIPGRDLDTVLKEEGIQPLEKVLDWARQVGNALSFLHYQNPPIVHRDVKPANIRLSPEGEAILVDFGIAKVVAADQATTTGAMGYTPGYAPPEQYGGTVRTGPYTDQYSLAALIYHLLTGQKPADSVQRAIGRGELVAINQINPSVPAYIQGVLAKALSLRPDDRYPNINEFLQALTAPPVQTNPTIIDTPTVERTIISEMEALKVVQPVAVPVERRPVNWLLIGGIASVVVALGIAAVFLGGMLAARTTPAPTQVGQAAIVNTDTPQPGDTAPLPAASTNTFPPSIDTPVPQVETATPEPSKTPLPSDTPAPTLTATPLPLGGGQVIVFSSNRADGMTFQLWSMTVSLNDLGQVVTSEPNQLTFSPGDKKQPAFSRDGTKILYTSPGGPDGMLDIWMMNADGSGEPVDISKIFKGNELEPAWSPDGEWIALTRQGHRSDGATQIYLIRPDGSDYIQLSTQLVEFGPAWKPDGQLGFVIDLYSNLTLSVRHRTWQKSGLEPTREYFVTPSYFDQTKMFGSMGSVSEPEWSRDGNWIVYTQENAKRKRIYLAKDPIKVVEQDIIELSNSNFDSSPAWSPDGQWIVFASQRDGNSEIYLMMNTGALQSNLTNSNSQDIDPAWQPPLPEQ